MLTDKRVHEVALAALMTDAMFDGRTLAEDDALKEVLTYQTLHDAKVMQTVAGQWDRIVETFGRGEVDVPTILRRLAAQSIANMTMAVNGPPGDLEVPGD